MYGQSAQIQEEDKQTTFPDRLPIVNWYFSEGAWFH